MPLDISEAHKGVFRHRCWNQLIKDYSTYRVFVAAMTPDKYLCARSLESLEWHFPDVWCSTSIQKANGYDYHLLLPRLLLCTTHTLTRRSSDLP